MKDVTRKFIILSTGVKYLRENGNTVDTINGNYTGQLFLNKEEAEYFNERRVMQGKIFSIQLYKLANLDNQDLAVIINIMERNNLITS